MCVPPPNVHSISKRLYYISIYDSWIDRICSVCLHRGHVSFAVHAIGPGGVREVRQVDAPSACIEGSSGQLHSGGHWDNIQLADRVRLHSLHHSSSLLTIPDTYP